MKFIFLNGVRKGEAMEFRHTEITIGRDEGNALQLEADGVSRYHAVLSKSEDRGWLLADQNSTNGTKINGKVIAGERVVFDGDVINIGSQELELAELSGETVAVHFTPLGSNQSGVNIPSGESSASAIHVVVAAPVPQAETEKTAVGSSMESINSFKILEDLKQAGGALFKRHNEDPAAAALEDNSDGKRNPRRVLFNVVFYLAIIVVLVAGGMFILSPAKKQPDTAVKKEKMENISVYYENTVRRKDNTSQMFRVELVYDNGKVSCQLNDVVNGRSFDKVITAEEMKKHYAFMAANFVKSFNDSGIGGIESIKNDPISDYSSCERMIVVKKGKITSFRLYDDSGIPDQVRDARDTLISFAAQLGIQAGFKTRRDIEQRSLDLLTEAKRSQDWFNDDFTRLRDAKRNYEAAIDELQQLNPVPAKLMQQARSGLDFVVKLRSKKYQECQQRFRDARDRQDYMGMENALKNMLELANEDSPAYPKLKKQLFELQQQMSRRKRK